MRLGGRVGNEELGMRLGGQVGNEARRQVENEARMEDCCKL